jgi:hypothetical protein
MARKTKSTAGPGESERGFAGGFVPKSTFGHWLRNLSFEAATRFSLTWLLFGAQVRDSLKLQDYVR